LVPMKRFIYSTDGRIPEEVWIEVEEWNVCRGVWGHPRESLRWRMKPDRAREQNMRRWRKQLKPFTA